MNKLEELKQSDLFLPEIKNGEDAEVILTKSPEVANREALIRPSSQGENFISITYRDTKEDKAYIINRRLEYKDDKFWLENQNFDSMEDFTKAFHLSILKHDKYLEKVKDSI